MRPDEPSVAGQHTSGEGTSRVRPRRADVRQLYEALEREATPQAKVVVNVLGMKLVLVPAGSFLMGSDDQEIGHRMNEAPRHEVSITQPFYFSVLPVTQEQYKKFTGLNASRFHAAAGGSGNHPVEQVSWHDAVDFCLRLSELPAEQQAGRHYRLPTEAEWEYACRGGSTGPFGCGPSLSSAQANFDGRFPYGDVAAGQAAQQTAKAGSYPANNFGLYDLHGNVWEWCADWYSGSYYAESPSRDPSGPSHGQLRVIRGGSWRNHGVTCRAAYRNALPPHHHDPYTGFRVACTISPNT